MSCLGFWFTLGMQITYANLHYTWQTLHIYEFWYGFTRMLVSMHMQIMKLICFLWVNWGFGFHCACEFWYGFTRMLVNIHMQIVKLICFLWVNWGFGLHWACKLLMQTCNVLDKLCIFVNFCMDSQGCLSICIWK